MSGTLGTFLENRFGRSGAEQLHEFEEGVKAAASTQIGASKVNRTLFETAARHARTEEGRDAIKWVEALISTLQEKQLQPAPKVKEALFFPDPQSERRLIHWLDSAQRELIICVFTITNNSLRDAVKRAHERGVSVQVISDDECMKQPGSDVQYIRDCGIPTEIDTNPEAHMHNKFVVIDKEILITGSFNWTIGAVNNNQENLVVLHDPASCKLYLDYFNRLWTIFRPVEVSQERAATKIQANFRGNQARKGRN